MLVISLPLSWDGLNGQMPRVEIGFLLLPSYPHTVRAMQLTHARAYYSFFFSPQLLHDRVASLKEVKPGRIRYQAA